MNKCLYEYAWAIVIAGKGMLLHIYISIDINNKGIIQ